MPGPQLILVVDAGVEEAELRRFRGRLGRNPLVLTAPTPEAARVVKMLGAEPQVELLLAPVKYPQADRGHLLDTLVRRYALEDRFRDVVVVTDPATSVLLLRTLAPDQLATGGAVTVVGLPRGERRLVLRRAAIGGLALGVASAGLEPLSQVPVIPGAAAVVGLALLAVPSVRHLGRELLLAAAIAVVVLLVVVASSARFPGAF